MNTVEGTLIVGTDVKRFSGLAKGGRQLESTAAVEENSERKPGITMAALLRRRPAEPVVGGRNIT